MRQESWFNPDATSVSDARGLMQLLPSTASRMVRENGLALAQPVDLYDAEINVELGTTYLKQLLAMFNGNEIRAVAAYNAGEHAVMGWNEKFPGDDDEWVENIGYHETRDYVKRVIGNQREYRMLYGQRRPVRIRDDEVATKNVCGRYRRGRNRCADNIRRRRRTSTSRRAAHSSSERPSTQMSMALPSRWRLWTATPSVAECNIALVFGVRYPEMIWNGSLVPRR